MKIEIEGISYDLETYGDGFPLLLLHRFTGDSSTWTDFTSVWGSHSKLIIPDIMGHGKTELSDDLKRYTIESAAHDLKKILDETGIAQADVLGYSMGGRLALTFALLYPDNVRKLILESASPGLLTEQEREGRRMKDGALACFIKENGIKAFVDYWEEIPLFSTMKRRLPASKRAAIRDQRLRNSPKGLSNSLLGMGTGSQPSWWGKLGELTCEVLLVTGGKDRKFCSIAEKMQQEIKTCTWTVIKESGHAIHVEEKEKFGTIVSDFLSKKYKEG